MTVSQPVAPDSSAALSTARNEVGRRLHQARTDLAEVMLTGKTTRQRSLSVEISSLEQRQSAYAKLIQTAEQREAEVAAAEAARHAELVARQATVAIHSLVIEDLDKLAEVRKMLDQATALDQQRLSSIDHRMLYDLQSLVPDWPVHLRDVGHTLGHKSALESIAGRRELVAGWLAEAQRALADLRPNPTNGLEFAQVEG